MLSFCPKYALFSSFLAHFHPFCCDLQQNRLLVRLFCSLNGGKLLYFANTCASCCLAAGLVANFNFSIVVKNDPIYEILRGCKARGGGTYGHDTTKTEALTRFSRLNKFFFSQQIKYSNLNIYSRFQILSFRAGRKPCLRHWFIFYTTYHYPTAK